MLSVLIFDQVMEEGYSWRGWTVQDHSSLKLDISMIVVLSYVKVTFSIVSATGHGGRPEENLFKLFVFVSQSQALWLSHRRH